MPSGSPFALSGSMEQPTRHSISNRVFPAVAVWAINKLLSRPSIKERTRQLDALAHKRRTKALKSLHKVGKNVLKSPTWLAGGLTAIALGVGMITKAAVKK
jgi:hypothetical protein